MDKTNQEILRQELFALRDEKYRDFHARLIPTVAKETILGIRTPQLRRFAKEYGKCAAAADFLKDLPHDYYEENNLHAFLIEQIKDYNQCIAALDAFLPFVDNWATCDLMRPKAFAKHLPQLILEIPRWMASDRVYTVRFGIEMLMTYYLDSAFLPEYLSLVAKVSLKDYYVEMMVAWYFATALAKQWPFAVTYLTQKKLSPFVHQKTIQKAVESFRITPQQKAYLKTLRMPKNGQSSRGSGCILNEKQP